VVSVPVTGRVSRGQRACGPFAVGAGQDQERDMFRNTLITTTAAVMLAVPAFAVPEAGDRELTLGAIGSNDRDFHSGGFNLNGDVGYYITDAWQVSARQSISYAEINSSSTSLLSTGAALDYHFDMGQFRPF